MSQHAMTIRHSDRFVQERAHISAFAMCAILSKHLQLHAFILDYWYMHGAQRIFADKLFFFSQKTQYFVNNQQFTQKNDKIQQKINSHKVSMFDSNKFTSGKKPSGNCLFLCAICTFHVNIFWLRILATSPPYTKNAWEINIENRTGRTFISRLFVWTNFHRHEN